MIFSSLAHVADLTDNGKDEEAPCAQNSQKYPRFYLNNIKFC